MKLSDEVKRKFSIQSYTPKSRIDGVELVELKRHVDDGGSLTELGRLAAGAFGGMSGFTVQQVNYSEVAPGAIKAFHLHLRQTDVWFVPPADRVLCVLIDARAGSRTEGVRSRVLLGDGRSQLLRIPPGVAHGARNLASTTARIIYFTDLQFTSEPDTCDEGRLAWDFAGAEIWNVARE